MLKYYVLLDKYKLKYMRHDAAHRKNSPAVLYYDGDIYYMEYGNFHNWDGPSNISTSGRYLGYYIRGFFHTKDRFHDTVRNKNIKK